MAEATAKLTGRAGVSSHFIEPLAVSGTRNGRLVAKQAMPQLHAGGTIAQLPVGSTIRSVNAGSAQTRLLDDGWTVVTADGRRSAHFEHTIAVGDNGPEVLTLPW